MQRKLSFGLALALTTIAAPSFAGVTLSSDSGVNATTFQPGAVIQSTLTPTVGVSGVYQQDPTNTNVTPAGPFGNGTGQYRAWSQTITTGAVGFTLDRFAFVTAGGHAGTGTNGLSVQVYQTSPAGGNGVGGYVDVANGTALLAPNLNVTINGQGSDAQIRYFDLTGSDEITLAPNTQYTFDLSFNANTPTLVNGGTPSLQFSRLNIDNALIGAGNGHATSSSAPLTAGGQRFGLSGTNVDYAFAVYGTVIPEPASLSLLGLGAMLVRRRRA